MLKEKPAQPGREEQKSWDLEPPGPPTKSGREQTTTIPPASTFICEMWIQLVCYRKLGE